MKLSENRRVILGCLVAGLLGGLAIATSWKMKSDKDFWDVASAVGTMAAAMIALAIALRDGMQRAKSDRAKAVIVAARVAVKLDVMTERAYWLMLKLEKMPQRPENRESWYDAISEYAKPPLPEVSIEDLAALETIVGGCGHVVARGMAVFDLLRSDVEATKPLFGMNDVPAASLRNLTTKWHGIASGCHNGLASASRICKNAAL